MSILAWIEDQKRLKLLNAPKHVNPASDSSKGLWTRCDKCGVILYIKHLKENQRVCFGCSYHLQMTSQERVENLLDRDSWRPLDETVSPCDPLDFHDQKNYTDRLQEAQERTGLQDAIQTGSGMVDGIPIALGVMDFDFMGGSMGSVVGEKVTRLIEYATQEGLTLVLVCASGGARMQEGVFSLMQMAKISSALQVYQTCANLLYISILTSPTTGGVTASFAMLGDIIFAEPKALIAFAGRRVIEQTLCEDLPEDFQTSEYMLHHGLLDLIVPRRFLRQALSESIRLYKNAAFKKPGRIPFGVQNPISFLVEEKIRRRWSLGSKSQGMTASGHRDLLSSISDKSQHYAPSASSSNVDDVTARLLLKQLPENGGTPKDLTKSSKEEQNAHDLIGSSSGPAPIEHDDSVTSSGSGQAELWPVQANYKKGEPASALKNDFRSDIKIRKQADSSSYQSLRRESGEYRNICTSFQTMFNLFENQLILPYSSHPNSGNNTITNSTSTSSTEPVTKQKVVASKGRLSNVSNLAAIPRDSGQQTETESDLLLENFMALSGNPTNATAKEAADISNNGTNKTDFVGQEPKNSTRAQGVPLSQLSSTPQNIKNAEMSSSRSTCVDFLNQSIELAARETVEWRAFYVHQSISKTTGFIEDLYSPHSSTKLASTSSAKGSREEKINARQSSFQNTLFYRSICRHVS